MSLRYIVLLLSILTVEKTWAQTDLNADIAKLDLKSRQIVPPSPEAAELGKYGNTPVSLFTGTPKISIPIYELKGRALSLPVSLSYNASGFKPEDLPTWVGLGWSLNAGGVVTRAVQGNPDNDNNYFGSNDNLVVPSPSDLFACYNFLHDAKVGRRELQPDNYYYNFANYSGKFLIMPDKTIARKERDNLKFSHCITCDPSNIQATDEQGNTYQFFDVENTRMTLDDEATDDAPIYTTYIYPSSWYLTNIFSADGHEQLLFEYYLTSEHYLSKNTLPNTTAGSYTNTNITSGSVDKGTFSYTSTPPNVYTKRKFLKKVSLLRDNVVISYIDFESVTGRLDAEISDERMLTRIKIYSRSNNTDKLIKQFDLSYGYFSNTANTFKKYRLRLDNLTETPVNTTTASKIPYIFEYNNDGTMPERYTTALDHWGFYNTAPNSSLVPSVTWNSTETYGQHANREPDLDGASYGILTKLKYPTGGYTVFEYELNSSENNGNIISIGGLRVKRIIDYSFSDRKATSKRYEYTTENGSSSGRSGPFPKYLSVTSFHRYSSGIVIDPGSGEMISSKIAVSASSIFGLGSVQGSHIGYSRVVEYQEDITNGMPLGKTVYNYHIGFINADDDDIGSGDLETQSVYDNNGKLLQEIKNTYSYKDLETIRGTKITANPSQDNKYLYCKRSDGAGGYIYDRYLQEATPTGCLEKRSYYTVLSPQAYSVRLQEKLLVQQTEKRYDQKSNSYILNTRKNTYDNPLHTYPTLIEDFTTGTEEVVTRKKYAGDYTLPNAGIGSPMDNIAGGISLLQSKNMLGAEIESIQYRQNQDGTNRRYINGLITVYDKIDPYPLSTYRLETATPLTTLTESSVNTSGIFIKDKPLSAIRLF